ncbi:hypothetical protein MRX96_004555 [Rhipicephalus microplus]
MRVKLASGRARRAAALPGSMTPNEPRERHTGGRVLTRPLVAFRGYGWPESLQCQIVRRRLRYLSWCPTDARDNTPNAVDDPKEPERYAFDIDEAAKKLTINT